MLLRPEYLSQKLDRPLPIKGAATLHRIGQAVDYISRALELVLFMDAKLEVSKI